MTALDRFLGRDPEAILWDHHLTTSLGTQMTGWEVNEKNEIDAVVTYGAMGLTHRVNRAASYYETQDPFAPESYRELADGFLRRTTQRLDRLI